MGKKRLSSYFILLSYATYLFLPHSDVMCDLPQNRPTAKWNLFVGQAVYFVSLRKQTGQKITWVNRLTYLFFWSMHFACCFFKSFAHGLDFNLHGCNGGFFLCTLCSWLGQFFDFNRYPVFRLLLNWRHFFQRINYMSLTIVWGNLTAFSAPRFNSNWRSRFKNIYYVELNTE